MQKQAPSVARIMTMVLFALSCFGLLLFLWVVFGGATPLRPKGYRFTAQFAQAGQLAQEADVRISGVQVGKVKSIEANPVTGLSDVVIEIKRRYSPIPKNTRITLRSKTLLGETYAELTPGDPAKGLLADGGRIGQGQIASSVQLDEIVRSFDEPTRRAFGVWQQQLAVTSAGRGRDISDTIAEFQPLEQQATKLLNVLNEDAPQLSNLIGGTGKVFAALSARNGQLGSLIRNSERVFSTTAARNRQLAETFIAFPTFERESRTLLAKLHTFSNTTNPLINQLKPAFKEFGPTFANLRDLAPDLRALVTNLGPAQKAGTKGLPAVSSFLSKLTPFLAALDPALANLNPALQFIGAYPNEITAFLGNTAAATEFYDHPVSDEQDVHLLRTLNPVGPETLAAYPERLRNNRPNPYRFPNQTLKLKELLTPSGGIPVYRSSQCTDGLSPKLAPDAAATIGQTMVDNINHFLLSDGAETVAAPRCIQQGLFGSGGKTTGFPQLLLDATPAPLSFGSNP